MYVVNRQETLADAIASATRLGNKHGRGLFAVVASPRNDLCPYAVVTFGAEYYDRRA